MCVELKVKLKSLAEESRIIRKEELKRKGKNWSMEAGKLVFHRKFIVRPEARNTHVAYGIIRGRKYHEIENISYSCPDWEKVRSMVKKYGDKESILAVDEIIDNLSYLKVA